MAPRGNTSGFVLDLPRAPATRLELDLPPGVKDVRVGNRPVAEVPLLTFKGQQLKGLPPSTSGPGIPDKLDLSWKGDQGAPNTPPVLTVDGRIHVQLDARGMTTTARLTLTVQGGQTPRGRSWCRGDADVKVEPADAELGATSRASPAASPAPLGSRGLLEVGVASRAAPAGPQVVAVGKADPGIRLATDPPPEGAEPRPSRSP